MDFEQINREIERLDAALTETGHRPERILKLVAARKALEWAAEPQTSATPLDYIMAVDTQLPGMP